MSSSFNCPNCGGSLEQRISVSKMVVCQYCNGVIMLEDDLLRYAGKAASLVEEPSIFHLGGTYEFGDEQFTTVGKLQCSYNNRRGFWEEWWCHFSDNTMRWMSVDEGEIAVQSDAWFELPDLRWHKLKIGTKLKIQGIKCRVTELDTGLVEAMAGELPEGLSVGDSYQYAHAEGRESELFTLEHYDNGEDDGETIAYAGHWIDPYKVRPK